jgi:hypothetical protein
MTSAALAPLTLGLGEDIDTAATWATLGRRLLDEVGATWRFNGRDFIPFGLRDTETPQRRIVIQLLRPGSYALMTGFIEANTGIWTTATIDRPVRLDQLRERVRNLCVDRA